MSALWHTAAADQLVWAEWDGEYVLFHRPSGKTHFVNAATALLLTQILNTPQDAAAAAQALARAQRAPSDGALLDYVESLLARLAELGLVERVAADRHS